jgi:carbohydrate diacid regulator
MRLELLLGSVSEAAADAYLQKCLDGLDEADRKLLRLYFASEMSLKETAEKCFVHVNTVQYQLRRVRERCGLDPRRFREASLLYTALRVEAMQNRSRREGEMADV